MHYIKSLIPMEACRLFLEMESGSSVTVDLSVKLHTMKYKALADEMLFKTAVTDGNYVIWGNGLVKVTAWVCWRCFSVHPCLMVS